jgi:IS4 transposase
MQDKDTAKSTFMQLFGPVFSGPIRNLLIRLGVDRYAKKLTTLQLIQLVVFAHLGQLRGLRAISGSLKDDRLSRMVQLESISPAQLSRRLRDLPPEIVEDVFQNTIREHISQYGVHNVNNVLGRLYLIDSTTVGLCFSRYPWAVFTKTKGGVKLHLRLTFHNGRAMPDQATVTAARQSDKTKMEELVVEEADALNVFDRAYLDYKLFDRYCDRGVRFVTRLKSNAVARVIAEKPVAPNSKVKKDQHVILGTNSVSRMKNPLRLIATEDTDGNPIIILTNDFERSAAEISDIYRYRWQIEMFFKWIKQHLRVKHFYGLSQRAVENQLFIALITYCLVLLVQIKTGFQGTLLTVIQQLRTCLYDSFASFVRKLYERHGPSSKGRRRMNHEAIFQETLRQVVAREADHLDDLTYDPVIL